MSHYAAQAGEATAAHFVDVLESEFAHLSRFPLSGSLRYAYELRIPELRGWPLRTFPYIIFYASRSEAVDVWRVLHAHRDMATWLTAPD